LNLEYIKVIQLDLPIEIGTNIQSKIDISEIYDRCLSRSITNKDILNIEFRINYSNELSDTTVYYRRNIIELCLNYFSSVTFQINDIQNDEEYDENFRIFRIFIRFYLVIYHILCFVLLRIIYRKVLYLKIILYNHRNRH
jgi:hypothetical protein